MFHKYFIFCFISCTDISRTLNAYVVNLAQRLEYYFQNYGFSNKYYYNIKNLFMMNYNISKIETIICCMLPHFVDN